MLCAVGGALYTMIYENPEKQQFYFLISSFYTIVHTPTQFQGFGFFFAILVNILKNDIKYSLYIY